MNQYELFAKDNVPQGGLLGEGYLFRKSTGWTKFSEVSDGDSVLVYDVRNVSSAFERVSPSHMLYEGPVFVIGNHDRWVRITPDQRIISFVRMRSGSAKKSIVPNILSAKAFVSRPDCVNRLVRCSVPGIGTSVGSSDMTDPQIKLAALINTRAEISLNPTPHITLWFSENESELFNEAVDLFAQSQLSSTLLTRKIVARTINGIFIGKDSIEQFLKTVWFKDSGRTNVMSIEEFRDWHKTFPLALSLSNFDSNQFRLFLKTHAKYTVGVKYRGCFTIVPIYSAMDYALFNEYSVPHGITIEQAKIYDGTVIFSFNDESAGTKPIYQGYTSLFRTHVETSYGSVFQFPNRTGTVVARVGGSTIVLGDGTPQETSDSDHLAFVSAFNTDVLPTFFKGE